MKQAALANEPDIPIVIRDNASNSPNKLSLAVIAVMSEGFRGRVEFVQSAVFGADSKIPATVLGDALNRNATESIRVVGVVKVAGYAFGSRVEFVDASVGGNPQIAVVVFHQILNKVGIEAGRVVQVVLVDYKNVTIVAIEAVSSGKPHESPAILQSGSHIALR
jgi:hypothetical protein